MVKLYQKYNKNFFFKTTVPISTKLGTKYPWVEGIFKLVQMKMESQALLQTRVDNSEIVIKSYIKVALNTKGSTIYEPMSQYGDLNIP